MRERPLSPHMSVYRMMRYTLFTSFANRLTGLALSLGLISLATWLTVLSQGEQAYQIVVDAFSHWSGKVTLGIFLSSFCYHLIAGIRHLIWDTGRGLERRQSMQSAALVIVGTIVLIAIIAYLAVWAGKQ